MMPFLRGIRFGFRAAVRSPGFAVVAVVTLAIGIGATTALFSVINAVLLRSFGYADIGRLAEISGVNQQGQPGGLSAPDFSAIERRVHSFQSVGASRFQQFTLIGSQEPENLFGQLVSEECFSTLGSHPLLGRCFSTADFRAGTQAVTVFSYKLWQ